jgi:hypothetical protein
MRHNRTSIGSGVSILKSDFSYFEMAVEASIFLFMLLFKFFYCNTQWVPFGTHQVSQ